MRARAVAAASSFWSGMFGDLSERPGDGDWVCGDSVCALAPATVRSHVAPTAAAARGVVKRRMDRRIVYLLFTRYAAPPENGQPRLGEKRHVGSRFRAQAGWQL